MVILKQERCRLGVVLAGCYVQGWQANFPFGVMLQQEGHYGVVALLESDRKWSEAVLKGKGKKKKKKLEE